MDRTEWRLESPQQGFITIEAIFEGDKVVCLGPAPEYKSIILAAPDLLAALESCLPLVERFDGTSVENENILDKARAAIARARGQS